MTFLMDFGKNVIRDYMKRLLPASLLISLLLASCSNNKKYNSYRQASEACKAWTYKGGNFTLINPKFEVNETYLRERSWSNRKVGDIFKEERIYIPLRWCEEEKETRQILGLVNNVRYGLECLGWGFGGSFPNNNTTKQHSHIQRHTDAGKKRAIDVGGTNWEGRILWDDVGRDDVGRDEFCGDLMF